MQRILVVTIVSLFFLAPAHLRAEEKEIRPVAVSPESGDHLTPTASFRIKGSKDVRNGTEGADNTFYGAGAGQAITSGIQNTFFGKNAGFSNTTANYNTFIGDSAGVANTTAAYNTFIGNHAGFSATTGIDNTFLGNESGFGNTTGMQNVFIGSMTGSSTTNGFGNTYLGYRAGFGNSSGYGNVFIGSHAGTSETSSNKLYIDNTDTLFPLIYGEFDTNIVNITGRLGIGTKSPGYNIEVNTSGSNACLVVDRIDGAKNYINATNLHGNFGTVNNYPLRLVVNGNWRMRLNADNSVSMASGASCTAGGVWTNASSLALKENITSLNSDEAAATLSSLNPVKYNYKTEKDQPHVGFIAEDVPELVAMKDRKSLSPMDIVAVLTRVLQEQQRLNREQKQINEDLKKEIAELKKKRL
jgi:hypothetical protein